MIRITASAVLFLLSLIFTLIVPIWTLRSCPYPTSFPNANVQLKPASTRPDENGKFPAGTQATIDCYKGYHLKYNELKYMLCNEAGEWISSIKFPIDSICRKCISNFLCLLLSYY